VASHEPTSPSWPPTRSGPRQSPRDRERRLLFALGYSSIAARRWAVDGRVDGALIIQQCDVPADSIMRNSIL